MNNIISKKSFDGTQLYIDIYQHTVFVKGYNFVKGYKEDLLVTTGTYKLDDGTLITTNDGKIIFIDDTKGGILLKNLIRKEERKAKLEKLSKVK